MTTEIIKAKKWAVAKHASVNHTYGDLNYSVHLDMVFKYAYKYRHLIDSEVEIDVFKASFLHDTIEDCRVNYGTLLKEFGQKTADIVYALTNEKGKTRKERASKKYYNDMKGVEGAVFLKICDRLANVNHALGSNKQLLQMYKKEQSEFAYILFSLRYSDMFNELNEMFK